MADGKPVTGLQPLTVCNIVCILMFLALLCYLAPFRRRMGRLWNEAIERRKREESMKKLQIAYYRRHMKYLQDRQDLSL